MSEVKGEADAERPGGSERVERSVIALALAASAGLLAALWIVDYLPTHDGPQHVFLGHLENHFDDPGAGWGRYLERGQAVTAIGFNVIFSLLERVLSWRTALRLTLSLMTLLWGWSYLGLTAALHPRRAMLGLLGFATALSWAVYMGFFSYVTSLGLGFATLAAGAGAWPWTPARRGVIAALLFLQAVAHPLGAELAGLVLLALVALRPARSSRSSRQSSARLRELGLLALMGLPALLIAATATNGESQPSEWLTLAQRFAVLPRTFLPGPAWRAWPPILLAVAGIAAGLRRARGREASPAELALLGAAALFLALAFTLPLHLSAWQFFAPRFLPLGCLYAAALLPVERLSEGRRRAALAGLAAFTAASLAWAAHLSVALRARVDEALAGLEAPITRTGPRLVVPMDPFAGLTRDAADDGADEAIPYYAPLFNLGALYAVQQGGVPPYTFVTNPRIHAFVFSAEGRARYPELYDPADLRDPRNADPMARRALVTFLAVVGVPFEDVVLHGRPEDGDVLVERGYDADFRRGGLFMGRFVGCPVHVDVITAAPRPAAALVEYGFDPMPRAINRAVLPPEKAAAPGATESTGRITPETPLCGPAWLRVTLDLDRSGGPSRGDRFCEGADRAGRVRVEAQRGATFVCRIAP